MAGKTLGQIGKQYRKYTRWRDATTSKYAWTWRRVCSGYSLTESKQASRTAHILSVTSATRGLEFDPDYEKGSSPKLLHKLATRLSSMLQHEGPTRVATEMSSTQQQTRGKRWAIGLHFVLQMVFSSE